jgi:hypothetical protein
MDRYPLKIYAETVGADISPIVANAWYAKNVLLMSGRGRMFWWRRLCVRFVDPKKKEQKNNEGQNF